MSDENLYLAEMGYAQYAKTTGGKNYQGLPMPPFEELTDLQKMAWIHAAAAIRRRVVNWKMTAEQQAEGG